VRAERIDLEAPVGADFQPVVRLIVGGIAERIDFGFEDVDDLQLAVERLLAATSADPSVRLSFEVAERSIRTRVGPLREAAIAQALQRESAPGELTLRRILQTVVDSFGVETAADGRIVVRLEKVKGAL
jgi:hypothetical protein